MYAELVSLYPEIDVEPEYLLTYNQILIYQKQCSVSRAPIITREVGNLLWEKTIEQVCNQAEGIASQPSRLLPPDSSKVAPRNQIRPPCTVRVPPGSTRRLMPADWSHCV